MSAFSEITALAAVGGVACYSGYAPTGAQLPYSVNRPLYLTPEAVALSGDAIGWDNQTSIYACGASVEASYNLAVLLMAALQGARVGGSTLSTSMGYSGAQVEGHYESQVTVQLNQGEI